MSPSRDQSSEIKPANKHTGKERRFYRDQGFRPDTHVFVQVTNLAGEGNLWTLDDLARDTAELYGPTMRIDNKWRIVRLEAVGALRQAFGERGESHRLRFRAVPDQD